MLGTQRGIGARGTAATAARALRGTRSAHARRSRQRDSERRLACGPAAVSRPSCRLLLSWCGDARSSSKPGTQRGVGARGAAATAARAKRSARSAHARRSQRRDQERRLARGSLARGSAALSRSSCRLLLSWRGDARSSSKLYTQRSVGAAGAAATTARALRGARLAHARQSRWRDQERRLARGSAGFARSSCRLSLSWRGDARSSRKLGTQRGHGDSLVARRSLGVADASSGRVEPAMRRGWQAR